MSNEEEGQICYCTDCADAWRMAHKRAVHELQELRRTLMLWQTASELMMAWIQQRGFHRYIQHSAPLRMAVRAYDEAQSKSQ